MRITSQISEIGYRFLPDDINTLLFGTEPYCSPLEKSRAKAQFDKFGLSLEAQENKDLPFPDIQEWLEGSPENTLSEATKPYQKIQRQITDFLEAGQGVSVDYIPSLKTLKATLKPGWVRYGFDSTIQSVEAPLEYIGVYDVETFVKGRNLPLMATYLSAQAIYVWMHPALLDMENFSTSKRDLVTLGSGKIVLNYNTLFDANKTQESYSFLDPQVTWVDLMSMHIVCNGASREQKGVLSMKDPRFAYKWKGHTTAKNSLVDAHNFHCGGHLTEDDKELRNIFVTANNLEVIKANLYDLVKYNILDTIYTLQLAIKLWPKYLYHNPHPVTFSGHCILGDTLLPVVSDWDKWVQRVEKKFSDTNLELDAGLRELADKMLAEGDVDFWTSQLDWTPLKSGKNKGIPKWYAAATRKSLSPKSAFAPILLRMAWDNKPLIRHPKFKWCYVCPEKTEETITYEFKGQTLYLKKIPHPKGENANAGNPLAKDYIKFLEKETLSSPDPTALSYLKKAKSVSYWTSMRSRVKEFYTVKANDLETYALKPYLVPHGTVTRRSVEPTWLTCSDIKTEIIGSELRSRIQAPKGFRFVGADFDAQELRIGSLMADAKLGKVGSSPMGLITMLGDKDKGTDGHSLLAKDIQVDRQLAKTLNFLMLFFGGQKGLFEAIKANRLDLPDKDAKAIADKALKSRRGIKDRATGLYKGGTDSEAYNWMIKNANTAENRTPFSKSAISRNLFKDVVGQDFMPSRCNRNIQSTGADILHIFVTLLRYFIQKRAVVGCFIISIHDEVWTMAREDHVDEMARIFQVCHLLTWVLILKSLGFESIPFDYCFFSSINVDYTIRKEVNNNTNREGQYLGLYSPSNPQEEVPAGYYIKPTSMDWG